MLVIDSLSKSYKDKVVINDLSLEFEHGLLGLLGPNGAGKTTLMKCIVSLIEYQGKITLNGRPISLAHVGYLPQKFSFFPNLRVEEALEYAAIMKNVHRSSDNQSLLSMVNLLSEKDKLVRHLSGGMLRRLGIAFALVGSPELIIVDEPTAGLDPLERISFTTLIKNISKTIPVLVSTHIVDDIQDTADVIVVMDKGRIVRSGSLKDLKKTVDQRLYHIPSDVSIEEDHWIIAIDRDPIRDVTFQRVLFMREPKHIGKDWTLAAPVVEDVYFDAIRNEESNATTN